MLRCALTLAVLSLSGPGGYWFAFWTEPLQRSIYITLAVALFVWMFAAAGWVLAGQWGRRRAWGIVLSGIGAGLAVPATVIAVVGLERALTIWNDQMGLLPWGLSRILGITVYLDIPASTAVYAAVAGAVVCGIGTLLAVPWRRRG